MIEDDHLHEENAILNKANDTLKLMSSHIMGIFHHFRFHLDEHLLTCSLSVIE
jgi:hypothetical protein